MVRSITEEALVPREKLPTAFLFLGWLGIPQVLAYAGQITVAIAAAGAEFDGKVA